MLCALLGLTRVARVAAESASNTAQFVNVQRLIDILFTGFVPPVTDIPDAFAVLLDRSTLQQNGALVQVSRCTCALLFNNFRITKALFSYLYLNVTLYVDQTNRAPNKTEYLENALQSCTQIAQQLQDDWHNIPYMVALAPLHVALLAERQRFFPESNAK